MLQDYILHSSGFPVTGVSSGNKLHFTLPSIHSLQNKHNSQNSLFEPVNSSIWFLRDLWLYRTVVVTSAVTGPD